MINASTRALGIIGSVTDPLIVLKPSVDPAMPWQDIWALALALVIGSLPVAHVLCGTATTSGSPQRGTVHVIERRALRPGHLFMSATSLAPAAAGRALLQDPGGAGGGQPSREFLEEVVEELAVGDSLWGTAGVEEPGVVDDAVSGDGEGVEFA
ncbi:hypothetical protein B046DRAFT_00022 [Streptomyces sp. LamerLS-316]|nr:hypothetical protein B046DRAFT_00022 [Streptomyces sp. LamerLS-316]